MALRLNDFAHSFNLSLPFLPNNRTDESVLAGCVTMSETSILKPLHRFAGICGRVLVVLAIVAGIGAAVWFSHKASTEASVAIKAVRSDQPVRVVAAERDDIQAWVFADGTARAIRREYLTFERSGKVTFVKSGPDDRDLRQGDLVKKGELLARLDRRRYESEIDTLLASLQEAKSQLEVAGSDANQAGTQYELSAAAFRRSEELLAKNATSQSQHEEAEAALKNADAGRQSSAIRIKAMQAAIAAAEARLAQAKLTFDEIELVSPIDGVIAYLNIEEGYYFTQNNVRTNSESDALMSVPIVVIDPSAYEITVNVPSFEAGEIEVGQRVLLASGGVPAATAFQTCLLSSTAATADTDSVRGEVFSVNPAVNPGGRSVQVKIRTTGGAEHLRDGTFVACWLETQNKPDAVVAPFEAFLFVENRPYVFVVAPKTRTVHRRDVTFGIQGLNKREIASGVQAGDLLVTDGRYRLVDGAPVEVVNGNVAAIAPGDEPRRTPALTSKAPRPDLTARHDVFRPDDADPNSNAHTAPLITRSGDGYVGRDEAQ